VTVLARLGQRTRYWVPVGLGFLPPWRWRSIFVLGHPRTGTNWMCQLLSHYFGVPMNRPWLRRTPHLEPVVLHLHRFAVVPRRTVYMVRDGRDVTVSLYHKMLRDFGPRVHREMARYCARPLTSENLRENLPGYIRYLFEARPPSSISYDRHLRRARRLGLYTVRYEDMLERGEETLAGIVRHLSGGEADPARVRETLEANSFEKRAGRKPGQEDVGSAVHRKGVAGDWRNHFTREAGRVYDAHAGSELIAYRYERDHAWVDALPER
jgi:hypothetical protein